MIAEFLVAIYVQEPYPAIILPGFGGIPNVKESFTFTKSELVVFTETGDSIVVNPLKLFSELPPATIANLLDVNFKKTSSLKRLGDSVSIIAGFHKLYIRVGQRAGNRNLIEARKWLSEKIARHLGRRDIERMRVDWNSYRRDLRSKHESFVSRVDSYDFYLR